MSASPLPPDLQQFAAEAIANGHYQDTADLIRTSVTLLRQRDTARAAFLASLEQAQREGAQSGFHSLADTLAELDSIIAHEDRAQA